MSILSVLAVLLVAGVVVYLVNRAPFVDAEFKAIMKYVVIVAVVVWLVSLFVPIGDIGRFHVGK